MQSPAQQDRAAAKGLVLEYGSAMTRAVRTGRWSQAAKIIYNKLIPLHRFLAGELKRFPEPKVVRKAMSRITPPPRRPAPRRKRVARREPMLGPGIEAYGKRKPRKVTRVRRRRQPEPSWSR
jgi:hypothetical protein